MKPIKIKPTHEEPHIILDKEQGIFEFTGRSLPENVMFFYKPIIDWFIEYAKSPNPETVVTFKLEYYNTATSKIILKILEILNDINEEYEVLVRWMYEDDDDVMEEAGDEYSYLIDVPFELISY